MRKKFFNGKRVMALALALSMVVGESGAVVAAPAADAQVEEVAVEEVAADEAVTEEAVAEEAAEEVAVEETAEASEETDEALEAEQLVSVAQPGKVTNLRFETPAQNGEIDQSVLTWNADQYAEGYEIRVTDAAGVEYAPRYSRYALGYYNTAGEWVASVPYRSLYGNSYNLNYLSELYAYKQEDGSFVLARDEKGNFIRIKDNTAYNIQVRAYNMREDSSEVDEWGYPVYKTLKAVGEWSDPITYNFPTAQYAVEAITGIVYNTENGQTSIVFEKGKNESVEMEIKDASGREYFEGATVKDGALVGTYCSTSSATIYPAWTDAYLYELKESYGTSYASCVQDDKGNDVKAFERGQAYTVRLRGVVGSGDEKKTGEWSAPLTVTVAENPVPQKTGQLTYSIASRNVTWNKIDNAEGYEVELKDAAGNWYNVPEDNEETGKTELKNFVEDYNSFDISDHKAYELNESGVAVTKKDANGADLQSGKAGTAYTVRVRAYNTKANGEKQYAEEWSEALTFTVPSVTAPGKVTGVKVSGSTVSWKEESEQYSSTYQIEVKDASGRLYTKYPSSKYDSTTGKFVYNYSEYPTTTETYEDVSNLQTYIEKDERPVAVIHPETGADVMAMEQGQTYTIRVRAGRYLDGATEMTYGDWSDAYTYTVPVSELSTGINAKPAQVTGVWIQTESTDKNGIKQPVIRWNQIDQVSRYEIEIKDSKGNQYGRRPYYYNNAYHFGYYDTDSNDAKINAMAGLNAYTENGDIVRDAAGNPLATFVQGETYKIRVRAINRYEEYDPATQTNKTPVEYAGDWSAEVEYQPLGSVAALTNLKLVREDDSKYYFAYDFNVPNFDGSVYYQIATDANFTEASLLYDWDEVALNKYKLAISKSLSKLKPSTTYYVRVVASKYGAPGTWMEKSRYAEIMATAASTAFTTNAQKAPKNITGLKLYRETSDAYEFRFDAVLDRDDDKFELQIASDPNSANWSSCGDTYTIYKSNLPEGDTYVRAVAYTNVYNEATQRKEKVYGQPSNVVKVNKNTSVTDPIGKIALAKEDASFYEFSYSGALRLDEQIEVWISDSKNFETNSKDVDTDSWKDEANSNKIVEIYKSDFKPGKTYYVKMRTYNGNAKTTEGKYSAFSNVIKVKAEVPRISVKCARVAQNSITLNMEYTFDRVTGYEIQKKTVKGKKTTWETLAQTSSPSYTDKKLKADTTYSYRVRPYYFDADANKLVYGSWEYCEAMTGWGGALNLKATAASKTSVKLSWNKIKGAKGYEVYRCVAVSEATQIANGDDNSYTKYKLIANVSAGKKSYTDKKLTSGMAYSYSVKAYKLVGGKKVYIEDDASVSLDFELTEVNRVTKSNGKVTLTWNPVYTAKGYVIEKMDNASGKWSKVKTIKKAKTSSYTFPATSDTEGVEYRVRAYNGKKYSNAIEVTVYPVLAAPTGVKAKVTKNGVKISWKAVKGADYYRVFRTSDPDAVYNKDTKSYDALGTTEVGRYVADSSRVSGYRFRNLDDMKVTSVEDKKITYSMNGVKDIVVEDGPETGVKYYYYVRAYKNDKSTDGYVIENSDYEYYASGFSKPASATLKESKPAKTSITKATSKSKKVTLKYKAAKNADGYEVERSTNKKKGFTVIKDVNKATTVTFTDKYSKKNPIKKGKTYYYRIRSYKYNEDGSKVYAKYSAVKAVKVK